MSARNTPRGGRWSPREPWPLCLARLAGMAAVLVAVGYGCYGLGWVLTGGAR